MAAAPYVWRGSAYTRAVTGRSVRFCGLKNTEVECTAAVGAFVNHMTSVSYGPNGVDAEEWLLENNRRWCDDPNCKCMGGKTCTLNTGACIWGGHLGDAKAAAKTARDAVRTAAQES